MSNHSIGLDGRLHDYVVEHGVREHPLLVALRKETASLPERNMQIAPEQGQFMAFLVALMQARRIIEIGTFTGYSSLVMALAQPPDGRILACDRSAQWTAIAQRYWREAGVADRVELRLGPAADTLRSLAEAGDTGWDLVFIDADKPGYAGYVEQCHGLLRTGGVILLDNTLWSGRVAEPADGADADTRALQALNRTLRHDARFDIALTPVGDGLTLLRKLG